MISHIDLEQSKLVALLKSCQLNVGGNSKLKIYGTLSCKSGKRMKKSNRVFFIDEAEAVSLGYRPCGHCMPNQHKIWKIKQNLCH
jgi:methylphosphotriester-DNA--protein-cysteine methyltransferase